MKRIIILQSIPRVLELVRRGMETVFSQLKNQIIYQQYFEKTLEIIPEDGELTVITSDSFYDEKDERFKAGEKNGNTLAREIKKINKSAKVYVFSSYEKVNYEHIDGYYQKSQGGDNPVDDLIEIFIELGLNQPAEDDEKIVINLQKISAADLETICELLGFKFFRFESLEECLQVYIDEDAKEQDERCLVINDTGEIFICTDYHRDNVAVNTVPVVLYLYSRKLLVGDVYEQPQHLI